jgi:hypothetical protein
MTKGGTRWVLPFYYEFYAFNSSMETFLFNSAKGLCG